MNTSEDEPSSGLNGRLRPRKSNPSPKTTKALRKSDAKPITEKPKRTSTPSKASPPKSDDPQNKANVLPILQFLCSFCDKTFVSKQAVAKHATRMHTSFSKPDIFFNCLFCSHAETESGDIVRHMFDNHPNQYFACLNCHTRFHSTSELAEHKLNVCEKQKPHYRNKLRQKSSKRSLKSHKTDGINEFRHEDKKIHDDHDFNNIVISCELKPSHVHDEADIEDNITTNLILPPAKNIGNGTIIEKNAVIVLDDFQWNKRIPPNFNFNNTDPDQILSRLGVVHRGPRTGEVNRRDWLKIIDETNQKFERCFDTSFYSKVASNVQENLAKFLDGSFNFNPDPDNTIKTRKSKNSVAINTAEGFPILLAFEQFSRNVFDGYMPRSIAPKHKWKWDNLEHDKALLSPEQIKRDSHANNCIITLVSSLDIWTQLCMRRKFENIFKRSPLEKKTEKQHIIGKELKEILEKRELPTTSSQVAKYNNPTLINRNDLEFPALLGLAPAAPNHNLKPAVLSGEWVRPRCYVCCACGAQARDSRALSSHKATQHPNSQIQHYEIVGEILLNSDIFKHLYVPPSQVNNRTRPLRGYRECTKCKKSITLEDLHQHMLDCAGDTPAVRRKCRTARPFGVRKRRPRLPDNTIRKEIRKDIRSRHRKNHMRPRAKNRTEVGDAETIRKMIADLPAKRHRVLVNPLNSNLRSRSKFDKQRNKLKIKKNLSEESNKRRPTNTTPLYSCVGNDKVNRLSINIKDSENRIVKPNINKAPTAKRHNNTFKRKPVTANKRSVRLMETSKNKDIVIAPKDGDENKCSDSTPTGGSSKKNYQAEENSCSSNSSSNNSNRINPVQENTCGNQSSGGDSNRINPTKENTDGNQSNRGNHSGRDNQSSRGNESGRGNPNGMSPGDSPFNTREHGNQSNSNSNGRDNQQSGSNEENGNQRDSFGQSPSVPLKHSIASLTASSETHDKAVQFHHLFLVQQECNNIPQHLPSDQKVLFENEVVDTKLDKPPLQYNHGGNIDPQTQKNKLNKPRKGLNDCIAMLKNKLVEPNPLINRGNKESTKKKPEPKDKISTTKLTHEIAVQCAEFDSRDNIPPTLLDTNMISEVSTLFVHKKNDQPKELSTYNAQMANYNELNTTNNIQGKILNKNEAEEEFTSLKKSGTKQVKKSISSDINKNTSKNVNKNPDFIPDIQGNICSNKELIIDITEPINKNKELIRDNFKYIKGLNAENKKELNSKTGEVDKNNKEIASQLPVNVKKNHSITQTVTNTKRSKDANTDVSANVKKNVEDTVTMAKVMKNKRTLPEKILNIKNTKGPDTIPNMKKMKEIAIDTTTAVKKIKDACPESVEGIKISNNHISKTRENNQENKEAITQKHVSLRQNEATPENILNIIKKKEVSSETITTVTQNKEATAKSITNFNKNIQSLNIIDTEILRKEERNHSKRDDENSVIQGSLAKSIEKDKHKFESTNIVQDINTQIIQNTKNEDINCVKKQISCSKEKSTVNNIYTDTKKCSLKEGEIAEPESVNQKVNCQEPALEVLPQEACVPELCQNLFIHEDSQYNSDIPPAHCNIQMESILVAPLDLSGKISSTGIDRPTSYVTTYDNCETLDLSNKNANREDTLNFPDEDIVDLSVKYPSQTQFEIATTSLVSDTATDLSLGNIESPKDLSLKGLNRSISGDYNLGNDCINNVSSKSHHNSCSSDLYEENACLDFSLKDNADKSSPTDLSGKNDKPWRSAITENDRRLAETATNLCIKNVTDMPCPIKDLTQNTGVYEPLQTYTMEESNYSQHHQAKTNQPILSESISEHGLNANINITKDTRRLVSEITDMSLPSEITNNYSPPLILKKHVHTDKPMISQPSEVLASYAFTKAPVCLSETVTTSLPTYNFVNRALVTPSNKYESTTPVYTLANACISVTKIETSNSVTLSNILLSIPGNTITNTTSVYTLAGTTIGTPLNYSPNSTAKSEATVPLVNMKTNSETRTQNLDCHNNSNIPTNHQKNIKENDVENLGINIDQDPETARQIALLPKELVEILGTMPLDHRKQLLNVLPQYVSTSTPPSGSFNQDVPSKFRRESLSPLSNKNSLVKDKTEMNLEKIHLNSIPSPSTLTLTGISPTTVTSSFLLTPPTPSLCSRQMIKNRPDRKSSLEEVTPSAIELTPDSDTNKNLKDIENYSVQDRIIDLTGDDNSQSSPEVNVHTTSDISPESASFKISDISSHLTKIVTPKTNNDKTASLRAVRIKTQLERQKSALPENQLRKKSVEVPVSSEKYLEDTKITLDTTTDFIIQQGEITSTQNNVKTVTFESKTSTISLNKEPFIQKRDCNEYTEKEVILKTKTTFSKAKNINLEMSEDTTKYDTCITSSIKTNSHDNHIIKIDDSCTVTSFSSMIKSDELITDNNNIVMKYKYDNDDIQISKDQVSTPTCNTNISEEEDSDDDLSLAVIVKQRNRDRSVESTGDVQSEQNKKDRNHKTSFEHPTSSSPTQSINVITKVVSNVLRHPKSPDLSKATVELPKNDKSHSRPKEKTKKKARKNRRNNKLIVTKHDDSPITEDYEFDINKENNVTSEMENVICNDQDTECVSSRTSDKDQVMTSIPCKENLNDNNELTEEYNSIEASSTRINDDIKETESNMILNSTDQTNIKSATTQKAFQDHAKNLDLVTEKINLIPKVITKKLDVRSSISIVFKENSEDLLKKSPLTVIGKIGEQKDKTDVECDKHSYSEESTVTPLRRSRRGKSLFIDGSLACVDNPVSSENILEYRAPLTKKQLIFSKLLLDEEQHEKPFSKDKIDEELKASSKNDLQETSSDINLHVPSNNQQINNEDLQLSLHTKTNKRKKSQLKQKCKKKKLHSTILSEREEKIEPLPKRQHQHSEMNTGKEECVYSTSGNTLTSDLLDSEVSFIETHRETLETTTTNDELNKTCTDDINSSQKSSILKKLSPAEKRKSDDTLSCSKPKKSKGSDNDNNNDEIPRKNTITQNTSILDTKVKGRTLPCYSKPVAAKRGRSKSVFVNSSVSEHYDPYDIDFEEMNEISELTNSKSLGKACSKVIKSTKSNNFNTSKLLTNNNASEQYEAVPSTSKSESIYRDNVCEFDRNIVSNNSESMSDSDESSKSDVPLKKYAEEKEKKLLDGIDSFNKVKETKDNKDYSLPGHSKSRKKNKRLPTPNDEVDDAKAKQESEEQLRSEQFMESFGFFSERKPRKSNLLATKKISETLANETDDAYFVPKERNNKKITTDKKHTEEENMKNAGPSKENSQDKKSAKSTRKKKNCTLVECTFCQICKTEFRRPDNYLRHQMSLLHISKLSEVELKVKTTPVEEEPNYLIAYKLQLDRLKVIQDTIEKRKKNSLPTDDLVLPTLDEILAGVKRAIREQQLSRRGLSRDEALFLDCCELLKESHKGEGQKVEKENVRRCNSFNCALALEQELILFEKSIDQKSDNKNDGDVDSITAQNILESEEVRNLENDLISGLKEAANAANMNETNRNYQHSFGELQPESSINGPSCSSVNNEPLQSKEEEVKNKSKRNSEVKEKMYPDIEDFDLFEDKFDKIKRKCRSQAAAAKQSQTTVEAKTSYKVRKNKKKGKKKIKNSQNAVMTKGALKGFDGIKVSIVTTDINMSGIVPITKSSKKKKKNLSKKKRDRKSSEQSTKNDSDNRQHIISEKKLDVYEFMDTDDAEVFDFRPSTIMERFKSINNKDIPSTSKNIAKYNEAELSSDSASDGDDFVYMSDDYLCSDGETENSTMSCELKSTTDVKKTSNQKRKEATEKSAVMGKIFKHNAVRSEKKNPKPKETAKPKANLDQLFDSLLQDEPHSSKNINEPLSPKRDELITLQYSPPPKEYDKSSYYKDKYGDIHYTKKVDTKNLDLNRYNDTDFLHSSKDASTSHKKSKTLTSTMKSSNSPVRLTSHSKLRDSDMHIYHPQLHQKQHDTILSKSDKYDLTEEDILSSPDYGKETEKLHLGEKSKQKIHDKDRRASFDIGAELFDSNNLSDDAGVARQRARRKCTVGKQNILAETWSSESEPDGMPPRPNSAESAIVNVNRRRKGRKKEGHSSAHKKGNNKLGKKNDFTSRVSSNSRNLSRDINEDSAGSNQSENAVPVIGSFVKPSLKTHSGTSHPSSAKVRPRPPTYYWSEGEDEQEHLQQHGWIVGDSHKKLVTMLAHAKGRKRNNDEKRHIVE